MSFLRVALASLALTPLMAWAEAAHAPSSLPIGAMDIVAQFDGPGPSGIAVTPSGKVFVGFPRHAEDHIGMTLGQLVNGGLLPFPNASTSLPSSLPSSERLVSVHGMTTDARGKLWVIDDGKRAGIKGIPSGAAKVIGFDPDTGQLIASVVLKAPTLLQDSHMNDLRVDLTHGRAGTAYVSDSSFGTSPALVVVDLATGQQRRVLSNHPSVKAEDGFVANLDGKPMPYNVQSPTFPVGGVDAIALSADSRTLYYAPLSSRRLYSIPTDVLADFRNDDATLSASVKDLGEKGFADGMAADAKDRLYITDSEHDEIVRRWPDGHFDVVARDPRIVWPDGIFATDQYVYVTLGQWNRLSSFNQGKDLRQPPYLLVRFPLDEAAPLNAAHAP